MGKLEPRPSDFWQCTKCGRASNSQPIEGLCNNHFTYSLSLVDSGCTGSGKDIVKLDMPTIMAALQRDFQVKVLHVEGAWR